MREAIKRKSHWTHRMFPKKVQAHRNICVLYWISNRPHIELRRKRRQWEQCGKETSPSPFGTICSLALEKGVRRTLQTCPLWHNVLWAGTALRFHILYAHRGVWAVTELKTMELQRIYHSSTVRVIYWLTPLTPSAANEWKYIFKWKNSDKKGWNRVSKIFKIA